MPWWHPCPLCRTLCHHAGLWHVWFPFTWHLLRNRQPFIRFASLPFRKLSVNSSRVTNFSFHPPPPLFPYISTSRVSLTASRTKSTWCRWCSRMPVYNVLPLFHVTRSRDRDRLRKIDFLSLLILFFPHFIFFCIGKTPSLLLLLFPALRSF